MKKPKYNEPVKAYKNQKFIKSPEARTIRIIAEYLEPLKRLEKHNVKNTIVFFGSARIMSQPSAERNIKEIENKINNYTRKKKSVSKLLFDQFESAKTMLEMVNYYNDAVTIASMLTKWSKTLNKEKKFLVTSGGGPGIMQAANKGAFLAGGESIGFNINLPFEQVVNRYVSKELCFTFHYFFMRKFWFLHLAKAIICFPGGYGTLDELMNVLVLAQTKKLKNKMVVISILY